MKWIKLDYQKDLSKNESILLLLDDNIYILINDVLCGAFVNYYECCSSFDLRNYKTAYWCKIPDFIGKKESCKTYEEQLKRTQYLNKIVEDKKKEIEGFIDTYCKQEIK